MIVNIVPDYDEKEFSEVHCSKGSERHYNLEWMEEWEQKGWIGRGMLIDTEEIQPNVPFSLITKYLEAPASYDGTIAVAIMDKNGQVRSILRSVDIDDYTYSPTFAQVLYVYADRAHYWEDLIYDGEIEDGMRTQLVARRKNENEWKIVEGGASTPTGLPIKGNTIGVVKEIVSYHGIEPDNDGQLIYKRGLSQIGGLQGTLTFDCRFGIANMYVDGKYYMTIDDMGTKNTETELFKDAYCNPIRYIDIYYTPQNNLSRKTVQITTPGTLSTFLQEDDMINLYGLKINGTINSEDIGSLSKLYVLGELDLSDAEIEGGIWPSFPYKCKVLDLPKNVKDIEPSTENSWPIAKIVNFPAGLENCEYLKSAFIVFNSPVPPKVDKASTPNGKFPSVLLVPKGSKEAYSKDDYWSHFMEIIEMDPDDYFAGRYYMDGSLPVFQITNKLTAISSGFKFQKGKTLYIPNEYYVDEYDYVYIDLPFEKDGKQFNFIKQIFTPSYYLDRLQGIDVFFLPDNGFIKGLGNMLDSSNYMMGYIITPSLQPNFANLSGKVFVPAHSSIGKSLGTEDDLNNRIFERYQMFYLICDKERNLISVASTYRLVTIKQVSVNGNIIQPDGTVYHGIDFSKDVEISVTYDFDGVKTMTTTYPPEFIANMESTGIPEINDGNYTNIEVNGLNNQIQVLNAEGENIAVYNMLGVQLTNIRATANSTAISIEDGIYIVAVGNKTFKVLVY